MSDTDFNGKNVLVVGGTSGIGRAVATALVALGAEELRLVDRESAKAEALASELRALKDAPDVKVYSDAETAAWGASGLLNGTPVGMVGYDGTPLPRQAMAGAKWAFDAVYTPIDTQFLNDAAAEDLTIISGYELFFFQGVHAWSHFSGLPLDKTRLRADLLEKGEAA